MQIAIITITLWQLNIIYSSTLISKVFKFIAKMSKMAKLHIFCFLSSSFKRHASNKKASTCMHTNNILTNMRSSITNDNRIFVVKLITAVNAHKYVQLFFDLFIRILLHNNHYTKQICLYNSQFNPFSSLFYPTYSGYTS